MRIISADRLDGYCRRHPDAAGWLAAWRQVTQAARWRNLVEVRRTYPHADAVKVAGARTITVFNARGNKYRLLTAIDYPSGIVNVVEFLTHAEYDKEKWKETL
jgi:mRNA interferase HigB